MLWSKIAGRPTIVSANSGRLVTGRYSTLVDTRCQSLDPEYRCGKGCFDSDNNKCVRVRPQDHRRRDNKDNELEMTDSATSTPDILVSCYNHLNCTKMENKLDYCRTYAYPRSECDTDHQLLVVTLKVRLAKRQNDTAQHSASEFRGTQGRESSTVCSRRDQLHRMM